MTQALPAAPAGARAAAQAAPGGTLARLAGWSFVLFAATLPVAMAPMNLAGGLCAVLTVAVWITRPGPRWVRSPVDVPALAWLVAIGVATLFAVDPRASATRLDKGLVPLLTGLVAWHCLERRRGAAAVAALLTLGALAALLGCGRFVAAGARFPARAIGITGTWMTFGLQMMMLVSLAAGIAITARRRAWRLGALAAGSAAAVGLVTSFTRSAWLGLIVAFAVMLALRRPRGLLALALVAALAWFVLPGDLGDRLRSSFDVRHPRNLERTMMWESGIRVIRDHPVTGVGLHNLAAVLDRYRSPLATEHPAHVHNSYLQAAVATGIIGLIPFLALCVALVRTAGAGLIRDRRATGLAAGVRLGALGGVAGFLMGALFDHAFGDEPATFMLFTLAGLAWAARRWDGEAPAAGMATVAAPAAGGRTA